MKYHKVVYTSGSKLDVADSRSVPLKLQTAVKETRQIARNITLYSVKACSHQE